MYENVVNCYKILNRIGSRYVRFNIRTFLFYFNDLHKPIFSAYLF